MPRSLAPRLLKVKVGPRLAKSRLHFDCRRMILNADPNYIM
jgi:hypothetical protein